MRAFSYVRAASAEEAVSQYRPGTAYLGGGTNLVDLMRLGVAAPDHIIDVTRAVGDGIAERFQWTRTIDAAEVEQMKPKREEVAQRMAGLLGDDAVLCLPTAPGIAPKLATPFGDLEAFRARAFALLCVAGLARLPQISLPLGTIQNCPLGLSLIAPRGTDSGLLDWGAATLP